MFLSASDKLQVILAAAKATTDSPVTVNYSSSSEPNGTKRTNTNGVTAVDVLAAPRTGLTSNAPHVNRQVTGINLYNADTASLTATFRIHDGTDTWAQTAVTVNPGQTMQWTPAQGWTTPQQTFPAGRLVTMGTAGTAFGTFTTAKTVLPAAAVPTLPAGFFTVGKTLEINVMGGISNIVTTPGLIAFQVMVGAVIAFTTGNIQLNATAHTLLPFWVRILMTCRAVGATTAANCLGMATAVGVMFTNTAAQVDGANTNTIKNVPATAPAVGTGFDSTIANTLDLFVGFTISDAANVVQIQQYTVDVR